MFDRKKNQIKIASLCYLLVSLTIARGDEPVKAEGLIEPVYRVTKQETTTAPASLVTPNAEDVVPAVKQPPHPLDAPLRMAEQALKQSRAQIKDYTAILVKRDRVNGRLGNEEFMQLKIRNEKLAPGGKVATPFSVYMKYLKPSSLKGREVIYIKGQNNGKLIAHEGGLKGRFTPSLFLDPNGALAMMGQRYPITDIGIERLCQKLIARGRNDRATGMCQVTQQPATINKRPATRIELTHPVKKPQLDFHLARIFVDDESGFPVRYEAYDWPATPGSPISQNELIEEFTYVRVKFNVGLTDADFDYKNKKYNMD